MYVAGSVVGWFSGSDGFRDVLIDPDELVGGDWIWLLLLPPVVAALAPFSRRWLSFLWLAPLPALLFVIGVIVYQDDISAPFPYYFQEIEGRHWGVTLSLVGAALATLALVLALVVVVLDRDQASMLRLRERVSRLAPARQRVAVGIVGAAGVGLAVALVYDPQAERLEDRVTELVRRGQQADSREDPRGDGDIRTHCSQEDAGQWRCVYEIEYATGSAESSSFTTDGSQEDLVVSLFGTQLAYDCLPKPEKRRWNRLVHRSDAAVSRVRKQGIDPASKRFFNALRADSEYRRISAELTRLYRKYAPAGPGEPCRTLYDLK